MLCLAKHLVGKPKGYIFENHSVQKEILKQVIRCAGKSPDAFGIDGCSVPTPFYDLKTIAKMFQKLGSKKYSELTIAYNAMCAHPYLVAGKNRFDTEFMKVMDSRAVSKGGGEAIQGLSIQTESHGTIGIALKIIDGSHRARDVAIMSVLESLKLLSAEEKEQLKPFTSKPIINHNGIQTGKIEVI
jgi:L-asparaginase II